jgi:glycosyltransferase involved in cell wall biosynthesis
MKILVLSNKFPYPSRDGGSIATMNMLESLRTGGNEVCCLSLNTRKHHFPAEEIPSGIRERIRFEGVDCDTGIRPVRLLLNFLFSTEPYIAIRFRVRAFQDRLREMLLQQEFDLVQLEGPYMGHYIETVRNHSKAAVSFRAHNLEHLIWDRKAAGEKSPLKKGYFRNMASRIRRFELNVISQCDCLVAISQHDLTLLRELGVSLPSIAIPTGLNLETYPLTDLPVEKSLFFIGSLDWLPNQEGLLWFLDNIFTHILSRDPGIRFHIAGRNAPRWLVSRLSRKGIEYHGEVEDALRFMESYRVMVAPLMTGSGIRIKILEAMAMGRPVVTTSTGIEGIPAEDGKEVSLGDDADTFINHTLTLISDDRSALRIRQGGRKLIQEKFDTFELSNRLNRFLKEQV